MPTYEYRCPNGHEFELFQKMSDEPRAECPDCGEESERILSGGAGVLFKGEGFYATDYRSEEYRKKASAEKEKKQEKPKDKKEGSGTQGGDGGGGKAGDADASSTSSASSSGEA